MPPEASITSRPATISTACFIVAGLMLSSSTASASPTSSTVLSCSSVSTSISIFTRCPAGRRLGALEHGAYAAGDRDVVVLDQDRVVEPEAVVEAAAAAHRVFLQCAQAGRGLARAADPRLGVGDEAHELGRRAGDAGEMADEVERGALG